MHHEVVSRKNAAAFDDAECIPPPLVCPPNIFNLWTPFYAEQIVERVKASTNIYTPEIDEKVAELIHHILILCNNNESNALYLSRWIGQMLKYPALKTILVTLISGEGAGKGTLIYILGKIMGKMETSDPTHIWGNFNGHMRNAFFVDVNEVNLAQQKDICTNVGAFYVVAGLGNVSFGECCRH